MNSILVKITKNHFRCWLNANVKLYLRPLRCEGKEIDQAE